ncbi:uncharacterized protein METZ01_LOCUS210345, partial [marine metagenome]
VNQLTFLPGHLLIARIKVASETAHRTPERVLTGERVGEGYFQTLRNRDLTVVHSASAVTMVEDFDNSCDQ